LGAHNIIEVAPSLLHLTIAAVSSIPNFDYLRQQIRGIPQAITNVRKPLI